MRDIEKKIAKEYLCERHMKNIEKTFRDRNVILGFRKSKEATLRNLSNGAAAKPHSILSKSIKDTDIEKNTLCSAVLGLVPYRNKYDDIKGLYLSSIGYQKFTDENNQNNTAINIEMIENKPVLMFTEESKKDELMKKLNNLLVADNKDFYSRFITGDYDLHDLVMNRAIAPSESYDEASALFELSKCVDAEHKGQFVNGKYVPHEFNPIQHGPQYNYIAHMLTKERDKYIVETVAGISNEIALYDGKEWTLFENENADTQSKLLNEYYEKHGLKMKWTWYSDKKAQDFIKNLNKRYYN